MSCKAESTEIEFKNIDTDKRRPTNNDVVIVKNYLRRVIVPLIAIAKQRTDAIQFIDEGFNDLSFDRGDIMIGMMPKGLRSGLKRAGWKAHPDESSNDIYFHKIGFSRIVTFDE